MDGEQEGTTAERLATLAELHRSGVLSDEALIAATSRTLAMAAIPLDADVEQREAGASDTAEQVGDPSPEESVTRPADTGPGRRDATGSSDEDVEGEPSPSRVPLAGGHRVTKRHGEEYESAVARLAPSATADGDADVGSQLGTGGPGRENGRGLSSPPPERGFIGRPGFIKSLIAGAVVLALIAGGAVYVGGRNSTDGSDPIGPIGVWGVFIYRTQGTSCGELLGNWPVGAGGQYPRNLWFSPTPGDGFPFEGAYWEPSGRMITEDVSADSPDLPPNQGRYCTFRLPYSISALERGQDYFVEYVFACSAKGDPSCIQSATGFLDASMFEDGRLDTTFDHTTGGNPPGQLTFSQGDTEAQGPPSPASSSAYSSSSAPPEPDPAGLDAAETAEFFFDAWVRGDRDSASQVATNQWVDAMFSYDPTGYSSYRCSAHEEALFCIAEPVSSDDATPPVQFNVWPDADGGGFDVADVYIAVG